MSCGVQLQARSRNQHIKGACHFLRCLGLDGQHAFAHPGGNGDVEWILRRLCFHVPGSHKADPVLSRPQRSGKATHAPPGKARQIYPRATIERYYGSSAYGIPWGMSPRSPESSVYPQVAAKLHFVIPIQRALHVLVDHLSGPQPDREMLHQLICELRLEQDSAVSNLAIIREDHTATQFCG